MPVIFANEILRKIFEFSDMRTLHSCLLSSRVFCANVVPLLWSTPLEHLYSDPKTQPEWIKVSLIGQIYISCLTDDSISLLKSHEISFNSTIGKLRPTYDYASFLQSLDYKLLFDCVAVWLNQSQVTSIRSTRKHYLIIEELTKLFFIRTTNLKSVSCKKWENLINYGLAPNYLTITDLPSAEICLRSLDRFSVKDSIPIDFCVGFSRVSRSIKDLEIQPVDREDDELFAELIKSQKELKKIIIFAADQKNCELPEIANALKQHIRSLKTVNLCYKIPVPLEIFIDCVNLVDLKISHLNQLISSSTFESICKTQFTQLKVLHINTQKLYLDQIAMLIQNTGGQIVDVYLEYERAFGTEHSVELVNSIAENCPNLKELRVFIPNEAVHRLPYLFASCPRLNSVCWLDGDSAGEDTSETNTIDISDVMIEMANVYPKNLYEFLMFAHWEFGETALEYFLRSCKRRLSVRKDRKLDFFVPAWGDDHIPIIKAYGNKGLLEMRDWEEIIQQYYGCLNKSDDKNQWNYPSPSPSRSPQQIEEQDSEDSGVDVVSSPSAHKFQLAYVVDAHKNANNSVNSSMLNDEFEFLLEDSESSVFPKESENVEIRIA
ncbi:15362_t:CDS:2 [Acaulospora colombiana]|uniref:15362_t:CDS:1 n=1 Tax=Acaulospora colombiana TaxID=27376 RepID=A0ACA9L187_9GLOM|nr:15362_t:CDS:2 [Acaulospora colombiana]